MSKSFYTRCSALLPAIILLFIAAAAVQAQTTAITYQGRFTDSTVPQPTTGNYEMEYKLFDTAQVGTGTQQGPEQLIPAVAVVNGVFTANLGFDPIFFGETPLFIEVGVRPAGSAAAFTVLGPRQQITAAPFAIRSRSALKSDIADNSDALGGLPAAYWVVATDPRLTDDRNPRAFSSNYIQNQAAGAQAAADFNISGNGTAGGTLTATVVDAGTQFNISGVRAFIVDTRNNTFAGKSTGPLNTTGADNSFFGTNSGAANTTGNSNSFFGRNSGDHNRVGSEQFGLWIQCRIEEYRGRRQFDVRLSRRNRESGR